MLLKGLEEVASAPDPAAAGEMVLIRLAYTADLPAPEEIIRTLGRGRTGSTPGRTPASPVSEPAIAAPIDMLESDAAEELAFEEELGGTATTTAAPVVRSFEDVVALAGSRREAKLKVHLEEHVSLVKFDPAGSIELQLLAGAPRELPNELREKLNAWTAKRWMVALSKSPGQRPLGEIERERLAAEVRALREHPAVAAVLEQFPDAEITSVRPLPGGKADETGTG
jgi:DNA polymerase-3 subunit gamma/tau